MAKKIYVFYFLFSIFYSPAFVHAQDSTSTNFIVRDPAITDLGGLGTSTNFQLYQTAGQVAPGQGSSTNFIYRSGFLFFPEAS